jgi:predicted dehydrogenase
MWSKTNASGVEITMNLRAGLIGCGDIGQLRAAALTNVESITLVAINDIDPERAALVSNSYSVIKHDNWRDLVHREDVDAIIVSTPPHLHAEMCTEALNAGKHVLCEKPLATAPEECQGILDAGEKSGRFVATGFNYRFYPSILKAKQLLDDGTIGELDHVRSYAGYSANDHGQSWVHDVQIVGGGALRDNGIHLIDLTCYFLGDIEKTIGFSSNFVWKFKGCEDNGFLLLRNTTGKIASLHASWTEWGRYKFQLHIYGTQGFIRMSCFPMLTKVAWSNQPGGKIHRKMYLFPMANIMERLRSYRWVVEQSFVQELHAFSRAIKGENTLLATGYDGMRAIEIASSVTH